MELTCLACGAPTARDGWCPRCLTAAPPAPADAPARVAAAAMVISRTGQHTDRSSITFGPVGRVGRVLWTVAIVSPPALVLWFTTLFAGWGFALLWWGVITPWALRDLWRSGRKRRIL